MVSKEFERRAKTYLDICVKVAFPILLGFSGWAGAMLLDHEKRVTVIEKNYITKEDAAEDREKAADGRRDLERVLIRIDTHMGDIDKRTESTNAKVDQVYSSVRALESALRQLDRR